MENANVRGGDGVSRGDAPTGHLIARNNPEAVNFRMAEIVFAAYSGECTEYHPLNENRRAFLEHTQSRYSKAPIPAPAGHLIARNNPEAINIRVGEIIALVMLESCRPRGYAECTEWRNCRFRDACEIGQYHYKNRLAKLAMGKAFERSLLENGDGH